jgi:Na+-translocating ferredoxin:NAD+ oxidoreductase RnfG subunit
MASYISKVYLTDEQASKAILPGVLLAKKTITLTKDEIKKIEEHSGERVRSTELIVWQGRGKKLMFVDQVLGKHEFITYAVGISEAKKVIGVEILEYRETYGQQVQGEEWRKQFVGKDTHAPLKLKDDIVNISGATLSSAHITAGIRRLLQTYDAIYNRI